MKVPVSQPALETPARLSVCAAGLLITHDCATTGASCARMNRGTSLIPDGIRASPTPIWQFGHGAAAARLGRKLCRAGGIQRHPCRAVPRIWAPGHALVILADHEAGLARSATAPLPCNASAQTIRRTRPLALADP